MDELNLKDFLYDLPAERIAIHPLPERDSAKLLVYNRGEITHAAFKQIRQHLPAKSFLFFNNTKVIPARLHFKKETGAEIEVFLLNPVFPSVLLSEAMQARSTCTWKCTIGNLKRWSNDITMIGRFPATELSAKIIDRNNGIVEFRWTNDLSFAEVVQMAGETPLPPYLNRKSNEEDKNRYQTIYSLNEGAVAAPTAGLHFTENVFSSLKNRNILYEFLTLHVSAGTFQPIKNENISQHVMHNEQVVLSQQTIKKLLLSDRFFIPVGTTSMRTLESIYWYGVKLLNDPSAQFNIRQDDPYQLNASIPLPQALNAILEKMSRLDTDILIGETSIFIKPGYEFKVCKGLITNFHQPGSTLILLVAAFVGERWKQIYQAALSNNYRFLSYGDSSLLIP